MFKTLDKISRLKSYILCRSVALQSTIIYTVNHQKSGILFLTISLANLPIFIVFISF